MIKFLRRIVLFLLPIFIYLLFSYGIFVFLGYLTEELYPLTNIMERQRCNHNIRIGLAYNEQTPYYKLNNADFYKAPVIALGSSRVMQFKSSLFNVPFYNCGGAVRGNYGEYINFLENLSYTPDLIILGLDQCVFNDSWNNSIEDYSSYVKIDLEDRNSLALVKAIKKDWKGKKWHIRDINKYPHNIGFNGRIKDAGFEFDGSYYYGNIYRQPENSDDYQFVDTYKRIDLGINRFEWGSDIDMDTMEQLDGLLSYCKERNISVVAFLPPFAPSVCKYIEKSGRYGYIKEIEPVCKVLFKKYGYEFFNYYDVSSLGINDNYFVDGFHGSEIVYAHILLGMASDGIAMHGYIDEKNIERMLKDAYSELTFLSPDGMGYK